MYRTDGGIFLLIGLVLASLAVLQVLARALFLRTALRMSAVVVAHTEHQPPSMMVKLARGETVKLIAPDLTTQPIGTQLEVLVKPGKTEEAQLPGWEGTWMTPGFTAVVGIAFVLYGIFHDWVDSWSR